MSIDWLRIRERGAGGLLTATETDALVTLARQAVDVQKMLTFCKVCGGQRYYDEETNRWIFEHNDGCALMVLEEGRGSRNA